MLPATRQRWHSCPYPSQSWYSIKWTRRDARLSWPSDQYRHKTYLSITWKLRRNTCTYSLSFEVRKLQTRREFGISRNYTALSYWSSAQLQCCSPASATLPSSPLLCESSCCQWTSTKRRTILWAAENRHRKTMSAGRLLPLGGRLPAGLRIYENPRRLSDPCDAIRNAVLTCARKPI